MIATFMWIWPPIFIKYLGSYFDDFTQNFYRYLSAVVFLLSFSLINYRDEFIKALGNLRQFILPTLLVCIFQTLWVRGIGLLEPGVVALLHRSNVLFVVLFSFLLFEDERRIIKSKYFVAGSLMAIAGVAGIIVGRYGVRFGNSDLGVVLILLCGIGWALYLITVKKIVRKVNTLVSVSIIFSLATPFFLIGSLFFGDIGAVLETPVLVNVLLFVSGICCVGIANAFNYRSIKLIGTAISSSFILITPFFTAILSYYIFGETFTFWQIISGVVLIMGCIMLLRSARIKTKSMNFWQRTE